MDSVSRTTAVALAGLGALHTAWGFGSSFPCRDQPELADTVAGTDSVPPPAACFAVSSLLFAAAGLVSNALPLPRSARRVGTFGVAAVLGGRGLLGVAGRTGLTVPWTPSDRFTRLDRRFYGPLCLGLGVGAARSAAR